MYEPHPIFIQPNDERTRIWRYLDFTKFVSLIDSRCLFFSRADKLGDPFEGSMPKINVLARQQIPDEIPEMARESFKEVMNNLGVMNKNWPRYIAINCWHMNEHESAAMWKLYLKSNEGIAIQSTYERLKRSLIDEIKINLGIVKYIDYENEIIQEGNILTPFLHKRKSYEHEQEVRAIIIKMPVGEHGFNWGIETIDEGLKMKTDIEMLIERIYIAPSAPNWLAELTQSVIRRYGYDFEVVHSKLDEKPLF